MAMPCFSRGQLSTRMACDTGCIPPPPAPWITRNSTSIGREGASPHSSELNVKMITHPMKNLLRPNSAENHPVSGSPIAFETRYDVSTHVLSSTPADKFPAMCGRDTFATLVSNTSMNVAAITVMAINQGFTCGTETGRAAYSAVAAIDFYTRFSGGRSFSPGNTDQSRAAGPVSSTSDPDVAGDPPSNLCGARQRSTTEI